MNGEPNRAFFSQSTEKEWERKKKKGRQGLKKSVWLESGKDNSFLYDDIGSNLLNKSFFINSCNSLMAGLADIIDNVRGDALKTGLDETSRFELPAAGH